MVSPMYPDTLLNSFRLIKKAHRPFDSALLYPGMLYNHGHLTMQLTMRFLDKVEVSNYQTTM
jgi:hypothetical protein